MSDQQHEILSQLNDSQREAVTYCDGPSLVIAGAGSGKTRVLTYKIAYLLTTGLDPWNILALTFTNKAAREMKERVAQIVGDEQARRLYMGTFHSIFSRLLRKEGQTLGYQPNFTIYDDSDSRSLIKLILKELSLDDKVYKPATVAGRISMAKNHLILPAQYANDQAACQRDREQRMPSIAKIYAAYQTRLFQANAMDFDDLLVNTFLLLRDHPETRRKYASLFRYILVDEYQDTNAVQVSIVQLLSEGHQRVCVVGDDYQSIYSFRGANIDNILDFQKKFPLTRLFKLERNYRSTRNIVSAASSLMKHNRRQIAKEVYSEEAEGDRILYHPCYSDKEEAMVVAKEIDRIKRQDGCEYDAFAILYRTNAQSRSFEDELRKRAIPYIIYGGLSFYQRKEIKDILAYFRLVVNPDDGEALRRIINYPARGIGNTTLQRLIDCASEDGVSLWEVDRAIPASTPRAWARPPCRNSSPFASSSIGLLPWPRRRTPSRRAARSSRRAASTPSSTRTSTPSPSPNRRTWRSFSPPCRPSSRRARRRATTSCSPTTSRRWPSSPTRTARTTTRPR